MCPLPRHSRSRASRRNTLSIDWATLRSALTDLRHDSRHGHSAAAFSRTSGLSRITIARVEDQQSYPDYRPDLDTIARWLTSVQWPQSLSAFIAQCEPQTTLDRTDRRDLKRLAKLLLKASDEA